MFFDNFGYQIRKFIKASDSHLAGFSCFSFFTLSKLNILNKKKNLIVIQYTLLTVVYHNYVLTDL